MKKILKNILIFISYFIFDITIKAIISLLGINYMSFNYDQKMLTTFIISIFYLLIILFLYKKELFIDLKDFKNNYKKYLSKYIIIYLIGVLLMIIGNTIISKITNQSLSGNEIEIRERITNYPLIMIFSTIIYAPIIEEIIFRKSIKNIFKNKYLFIIISGLIFGILHIANFKDLNEILYSIPYIIMGLDFAYIYYKTNNIFTTITFHFFHNLILLIIQLL